MLTTKIRAAIHKHKHRTHCKNECKLADGFDVPLSSSTQDRSEQRRRQKANAKLFKSLVSPLLQLGVCFSGFLGRLGHNERGTYFGFSAVRIKPQVFGGKCSSRTALELSVQNRLGSFRAFGDAPGHQTSYWLEAFISGESSCLSTLAPEPIISDSPFPYTKILPESVSISDSPSSTDLSPFSNSVSGSHNICVQLHVFHRSYLTFHLKITL